MPLPAEIKQFSAQYFEDQAPMHRFFVPPETIEQNRVVITGIQARQVREVLRLSTEDHIVVLDNTGLEYRVKLVDINNDNVEGEVLESYTCPNEPAIRLTLYQALLKGNKFEFVLQKCTEIGVIGFVPIICDRCISSKPSDLRLERWERIIVEASEQSRRGRLPCLQPAVSFNRACNMADGLSLLPWEGESNIGIRKALRDWPSSNVMELRVFIGPEGGFSAQEVEYARDRGIVPITLGDRILRAETAGLVTAAALLYEYGELG